MAATWQEFSKEISQAVAEAGKSIVAVDGRSGHTSSGIVWRADSILTAAHTIRHEGNIGVSIGGGKSVQARLAGRDRGTDIALLKLDQEIEALPAQLGSAASLTVGELTVAVARTRRGNIVASAGIISGLMGEWQVGRTRIDQFIRPDLNLYPGFSGGALLGSGGTVLGLNTSGLLRGRSITIPSSTLTRIAEEIATKGHVAQPYIGVAMQPVQIPESLQKKSGVNAAAGLLVMHVESGGPADSGGVLLGDILIDMDGRSFDDLEDLHEVLGRKGSGQEVQTTLIRGGQRLQITIKIGTRPLR
ncbi:MAG TPA: S1C family serine protease [Phycisphaerae bacterium]|jgi:S1-C subfamily serine protease